MIYVTANAKMISQNKVMNWPLLSPILFLKKRSPRRNTLIRIMTNIRKLNNLLVHCSIEIITMEAKKISV